LEQYNTIMRHNRGREEVGELLEDCPMDIKRLVAPIAKYRIVESLLLSVNDEAKETGIPFVELMRRPDTMGELYSARQRLDEGGDAEAQFLQDQMDAMVKRANEAMEEEQKRKEKERGRILIDMQGLKMALDFGQKCKKDGLVEWQRGNWEEAIASWRQGDDTLRKFRAPRRSANENAMILELHSAVLRNLAQAAIKLELWGEAIDAADRVLEMNSDDHKAWFRKACALEGLGNFTDARSRRLLWAGPIVTGSCRTAERRRTSTKWRRSGTAQDNSAWCSEACKRAFSAVREARSLRNSKVGMLQESARQAPRLYMGRNRNCWSSSRRQSPAHLQR